MDAPGRYAPVSRRPIADVFRRTATWATDLCVRLHVHPDVISYFSVIAAAAAAICFWQAGRHAWLLIIAPLLCDLRLWCNMLDGMVALASGQASPRGEILNDVPDRISDLLIFAGVAHSGLMNPFLAYWAALLAVVTAYMGLFGQALGGQREFGGIMAKPWRMVVLQLSAWLTFVMLWLGRSPQAGALTILDWGCLLIIAGCVQTIIQRLSRIVRSLDDRAR